MYYEILYETGAHSVACYEDDEEMLAAVTAHHARATNGELGLNVAGGHNAERIVKVLKYEVNPGEGVPVDQKTALKLVADTVEEHTADNGAVDLVGLAQVLRDAASPTVESKAHESNYKAEETEVFEEGWAA